MKAWSVVFKKWLLLTGVFLSNDAYCFHERIWAAVIWGRRQAAAMALNCTLLFHLNRPDRTC
jgi:hypothetical protein